MSDFSQMEERILRADQFFGQEQPSPSFHWAFDLNLLMHSQFLIQTQGANPPGWFFCYTSNIFQRFQHDKYRLIFGLFLLAMMDDV